MEHDCTLMEATNPMNAVCKMKVIEIMVRNMNKGRRML